MPDPEAIATCLKRGHDPEVRGKLVVMLAEETGWTPKVLAEKTGYSTTEIRRILPDRFKDVKKKNKMRPECSHPPPPTSATLPEPTQPKPRPEPNQKLIAKTNFLVTADSIRLALENRKIHCPKCKGNKLVWACCGGDLADPKLLEKLRRAIRI